METEGSKNEKRLVVILAVAFIIVIIAMAVKLTMENDNMDREKILAYNFAQAFVEEHNETEIKITFLNDSIYRVEIIGVDENGDLELKLEKEYYSINADDTKIINLTDFYDVPMKITIEIEDVKDKKSEKRVWQSLGKGGSD